MWWCSSPSHPPTQPRRYQDTLYFIGQPLPRSFLSSQEVGSVLQKFSLPPIDPPSVPWVLIFLFFSNGFFPQCTFTAYFCLQSWNIDVGRKPRDNPVKLFFSQSKKLRRRGVVTLSVGNKASPAHLHTYLCHGGMPCGIWYCPGDLGAPLESDPNSPFLLCVKGQTHHCEGSCFRTAIRKALQTVAC